MGRKKVHRNLPGLSELVPARAKWGPSEHKARLLSQCLRPLIARLRQPQTRPFYAMRQVARFFRVSVPTVAEAYRQLEQEGLLRRMRSSQTMLAASHQHPQSVVRGVVGLPVWPLGFSTLYDWRRFFVGIEEQLRRQQFVADFVFYNRSEFREPSFADRLIAHQLDYLVWFLPHPMSLPILQTVADRGVRVVVVANHMFTCSFPVYWLRWDRGLAAAFADLKRDGITTVELAHSGGDLAGDEPALPRMLQRAQLDLVITELRGRRPEQYLQRLGRRPGTAVLFQDDLLRSVLCREAPSAMADLARRCRPLVVHGGLDLPPTQQAGVRFDLVDHDWAKITKRLAHDISTDRLVRRTRAVTCHAGWWPRREAQQYAL